MAPYSHSDRPVRPPDGPIVNARQRDNQLVTNKEIWRRGKPDALTAASIG